MPDIETTNYRVLLGFDFGMNRIGVAVGQELTRSANPLTILKAQNGIPDWQEIEKIVSTWHVKAIVVGIPLQMNGEEQTISLAARKFSNRLKERLKLPVYLTDERLTTREAKSQLLSLKLKKKQKYFDSYAAKLILESWLQGS